MVQVTHSDREAISNIKPFRIARNTVFLIISQLIAQASMAVVGIIIARSFGPAQYGEYSLAFSFIYAFSVLFSMGAGPIVIRQVAQDYQQAEDFFAVAFWLQLALFPLAMLVIASAAWIVGYSLEQQVLIWLAALVTGLGILGDLPRVIFSGLQRMQFELITRSADKLVVLVAVASLVLLFNIHNLAILIAAMTLGGMLGLVLGLFLLRSQVNIRIRVSRSGSLNLLRSAAPLAGSAVFIAIYLQLPTLFLARFNQIQEVGFFNAANGIIAPFGLLPVAFASALLPVLASLFRTPDIKSGRVFWIILAFILLGSLSLAGLVRWFSDLIVNLLYGNEYQEALPVLNSLAWYIPVVFISTYLHNTLIASSRQRLTLSVTFVNLIVTVILGVLFIPDNGALGAAYTMTLAPLMGIGLMFVFLWDQIGLRKK